MDGQAAHHSAGQAKRMGRIARVLALLVLPPMGWWLVARRGGSRSSAKALAYGSACWFGLWPLALRHELRWALLGVLAASAAGLTLIAAGMVWAARRRRARHRRPLSAAIVGGLVSGLLLGALVCGWRLAALPRLHADIKRAMQSPRNFGPAHLDILEGLPVLHLYGTPEEMGRQYGTILRPALQAEYRYFDLLMPRALYRVLRAAAEEREQRLPEPFRQELRAIAEASGVPYEVLATANLTPRMHCTVLLAWGEATADGSMVFGRNSEYFSMGLKDCGSLIVVWHPAEGLAQLSLNFLGMTGTFNGANEAGLCCGNLVVFNALDNGLDETGLPIQFELREACGRLRTADGLRDHLLGRPAVMPVQVAMADAAAAHVVELGLHDRTARTATRAYLAAGNFFQGEAGSKPAPARFLRRYERLIEFAEARYGRIDARNVAEALYAARSARANIHSMVFEPARMRMRASFNCFPAAAGPFVELDLTALFKTPPATD